MYLQSDSILQRDLRVLSGRPPLGWPRQMVHRDRVLQQGFTLVELMVVIVILGLLSGVVTVSVRSYLIRSKQNVAKMELSKISQALETFYTTYDRYPSNQEGIALLAQPSDEYAEGILTFLPSDPWGNPYEYISPGKTRPYAVVCYGADHREGGTGADRDISSEDVGK